MGLTTEEKFTLFWNGPFSQWHSCEFVVGHLKFNCAEQFMMYGKATLFGDKSTASEILQTVSPKDQKSLGKKVQGFDEKVWTMYREGIVYTGSHAKFSQNIQLKELLLATQGTTLVEASPYDKIWGIGLAESDPNARVRSAWQGMNLLGEMLTKVREVLAWEKTRDQFIVK